MRCAGGHGAGSHLCQVHPHALADHVAYYQPANCAAYLPTDDAAAYHPANRAAGVSANHGFHLVDHHCYHFGHLDPDNLRDQLGDDNRHHFALDLTNHTAANQFADIRGPPAGAI